MADYNIYLRNRLGQNSGKTQKISAKGTSIELKDTMKSKKRNAFINSNNFGNYVPISGGGKVSSGASKSVVKAGLSKAGPVGVAIAAVLTALQITEKVVSFGVNIWEANTGESIRANNLRATAKTHASLGTNLIIGGINHALFDAKRIKRQNIGLEYGQQIYNLNYLGEKNKIR